MKSAVEWLYENLLFDPISNEDVYYNEKILKQAKEMEKQQIDETCADWWNEGASYMYDGKRNYLSFEQYYNEKFKK